MWMTVDTPGAGRHGAVLPSLLAGRAALHEFYALTEADAAAMTGVILAVALGSPLYPLLWVRQDFLDREAGTPYPPGQAEFGFDPGRLIFVRARDTQSILQAGLEGARCAALGAVLIELWGEAKALDLTASRRLALAAQASGTPVLMGRVAAQPCPSAAETRWSVRATPSRALAANAPGPPAVRLDLLRHRGGLSHATLDWEWNRDTGRFEDRTAESVSPDIRAHPPPLSGAVVPVPFDGQVPVDGVEGWQRRAG